MPRAERLLSLCAVLACAVMAAFHACQMAARALVAAREDGHPAAHWWLHVFFVAFWAGFAAALWRARRRWVRTPGEVEKQYQDWEERSHHDG